ncbi:MAG: cupin domain-containing protein [Phycisphaerae bacterium]
MDTVSQMEVLREVLRNGTVEVLACPESGTRSSLVLEETYDPRGHVPPHYHDCEEILVFLEGEGIVFIGQDPRSVAAGTTIVVPPGKPHCLYNTGLGRLHFLAFHPKSHPEYHFVPGLFTDETNCCKNPDELLAQAM